MKKIDAGSRLGTMALDHIVMIFVLMIVAAPAAIYDMTQTFGSPGTPPKLMLGNFYFNLLGFSLYFNKDGYQGRSVGKRTLKLQVVNVSTGKAAGPLRCLVRNITIVLWPIEVIVALINSERRIGDFIAGTKLIPYDPTQTHEKPNWSLIAIAIVLGMAITYLVTIYPIELLTGMSFH